MTKKEKLELALSNILHAGGTLQMLVEEEDPSDEELADVCDALEEATGQVNDAIMSD